VVLDYSKIQRASATRSAETYIHKSIVFYLISALRKSCYGRSLSRDKAGRLRTISRHLQKGIRRDIMKVHSRAC
jgi:hypothetical protein